MIYKAKRGQKYSGTVTSTAIAISGFGKLLMYYCNSKESLISLSQAQVLQLHVVGAEFTTGAEFSCIYAFLR